MGELFLRKYKWGRDFFEKKEALTFFKKKGAKNIFE